MDNISRQNLFSLFKKDWLQYSMRQKCECYLNSLEKWLWFYEKSNLQKPSPPFLSFHHFLPFSFNCPLLFRFLFHLALPAFTLIFSILSSSPNYLPSLLQSPLLSPLSSQETQPVFTHPSPAASVYYTCSEERGVSAAES